MTYGDLMPGQVEQPPPDGLQGWAVAWKAMAEPAVFPLSRKHDAIRFAAKVGGIAWPLVAAKRTDDKGAT